MESDKQQKRERSGFTNQKLLNKLKRMKKLFYYCLLLLPTLLIWQCKDDDYPPLPPVDTSLKFHVEDTLVMSTAGGNSTISLQSAKDWKLDVEYDATDPDKDWLSTDPTSGTASGTASVTVTTLASLVERKATLVLSQVGEDTEAPVRQRRRQGAGQVAPRLDTHAGQAFFCRRGQQRIHGLRIVCDGKTSGDEQFSLRQPARVVRCVRQIDTADPTAKSRRAAADRAARKHGQAQHLLQCGIVRCVL